MGALWLSGVVRVAIGVLATARGAIGGIRNQKLDDEAREKIAQAASIQLIRGFISIMIRSGLSLVASFIPIGLAHLMGWVTIEVVIGYLSRWDVMIVATVAIVASLYSIKTVRVRWWSSR